MSSHEELFEDYEVVVRNAIMWSHLLDSRREQLASQGISPETLKAIEDRIKGEVGPLDERYGYGLDDPAP